METKCWLGSLVRHRKWLEYKMKKVFKDPFSPQDFKYDNFDSYRIEIIQGIIDAYYLWDGLGLPGARSKPKHEKCNKRYAEEPMYQNQSLKPQIYVMELACFQVKKSARSLKRRPDHDEGKIRTRKLLGWKLSSGHIKTKSQFKKRKKLTKSYHKKEAKSINKYQYLFNKTFRDIEHRILHYKESTCSFNHTQDSLHVSYMEPSIV